MDIGAAIGGRSYAQTYELEADTLGAYVAARAGYDPGAASAIFDRPDTATKAGRRSSRAHPGSAAAPGHRRRGRGRDPRRSRR